MSPAERAQEGSVLKFIFPILTRTAENLALGETEHKRVWEAIDAAFDLVCPPPRYGSNGMWDCVIRDYPKKYPLLKSLAERTHASLLAFEKIVRKHTRPSITHPPVMG